MFLKTGYFNQVEEQVAYSQNQFDRSQKECMLFEALGFPDSLLRFDVGGPRIFARVAATMISKCFKKLGIIVHF